MAIGDNEFDKEIDGFFSDIERIPIERLQQKSGLSHGDAHRLKIDIALKLRDAQHTKALNQHTEALANWTRWLVRVTWVLAFVALLSVILGVVNLFLERNRLKHVIRLEKEITDIRSEVQKVAAQPRNPLDNPLNTESQKDK